MKRLVINFVDSEEVDLTSLVLLLEKADSFRLEDVDTFEYTTSPERSFTSDPRTDVEGKPKTVKLDEFSKHHHPTLSAPQIIMQKCVTGWPFTKDMAKVWLMEEHGFARGTVGSALSRLVYHGYIERKSPQDFVFLKPMDLSTKNGLSGDPE